MTINERIFEKINESGLSITEITQQTNIQKSTISRWKDGKYKPSIDAIVALSQLLNVSSDYLLFGIENEHNNSTTSNQETSLTFDEKNLLNTYRELKDEGKYIVQDTLKRVWSEHHRPLEKETHISESLSNSRIG